MDEPDETASFVQSDETELKQILGIFDTPAFARRGHELEYALERLRLRLARQREEFLDMVKLRLRQWAGVASGPDDWSGTFKAPVYSLYELSGADAPAWVPVPAPDRRRKTVARDLAMSVDRFNRRWRHLLETLKLDSVNRQIELYNRYYVLEKECVLGSARLAARHFQPKTSLSSESLLVDFPLLPVIEPVG